MDHRHISYWYADLAAAWQEEELRWNKRGEKYAEAKVGSTLKVHTFVFIKNDGWKLDYWWPGQ